MTQQFYTQVQLKIEIETQDPPSKHRYAAWSSSAFHPNVFWDRLQLRSSPVTLAQSQCPPFVLSAEPSQILIDNTCKLDVNA